MIAVLTHRTGELCLDKDFVLIEGHPHPFVYFAVFDANQFLFVAATVALSRSNGAACGGSGGPSPLKIEAA